MRGCPSSFCFPQRKGGLPSLPPADSAGAVPGGVAGGRLPAAPAIPAPAGGLAFLLARLPCLSRCFCPHLPDPLPAGKGESQSLFRRGLRPRHPGIKPPAALTDLAKQVPCAWEPAVRCKTDRTAVLLAVPVAKERGDRGRGTSAFEMVLSPGAGRASAAPHPAPGDARGEAPCIRKPKNSPFPMGEGGRGDGDKKSMMRQAQSATETAAPPSGTATAGLSGNAGASPPLGAGLRPLPPRRPGSAPGMQGAKPLA